MGCAAPKRQKSTEPKLRKRSFVYLSISSAYFQIKDYFLFQWETRKSEEIDRYIHLVLKLSTEEMEGKFRKRIVKKEWKEMRKIHDLSRGSEAFIPTHVTEKCRQFQKKLPALNLKFLEPLEGGTPKKKWPHLWW